MRRRLSRKPIVVNYQKIVPSKIKSLQPTETGLSSFSTVTRAMLNLAPSLGGQKGRRDRPDNTGFAINLRSLIARLRLGRLRESPGVDPHAVVVWRLGVKAPGYKAGLFGSARTTA
jgi:hypothetical protein